MTLFRIGSVPVRLHASFLALVVVGGVAAVAIGGVPMLVQATLTLGVFFGSVLIHELGHAGAAGWYGIATRSILLLPVGGAAELEVRRVSPRVDAVISLAGPVASLVLGVLALGFGLLVGWVAAIYVGVINLLLGVGNLLPAFPMDGGRILRALLVSRVGLERGTQVALIVGAVFAAAFAVVGLVAGQVGLLAMAVVLALLQWREYRVFTLMRRVVEVA
ncbi:MAG: site-2 protease family protein [Alphaproteobacteria bacterium]|nr:site-2 protease family protein [Alphaproteobacteria bacterium]